MKQLDWIVLVGVLLFIVVYGVYKSRQVKTSDSFLGGKTNPWWMVGLGIMATQASAITFLSTPGQAFNDGLGFVQFYFGLPIAMVILCVWVLPKFFKMNVLTAYEYLEKRFGLSTRILTAILFLIQRGLAAGITIFAPAIILSTILGWNLMWTNIVIGALVTIYTLIGGTEAVSQTQKQQMIVIFIGMFLAFFLIMQNLPLDFNDALLYSGQMGKLNPVSFEFDVSNRYNIWSAFLGGTFLFLSYFGTDQSQVQRYLTGKSLKEARLGLLFNGLFKIPMQFFILFIGVMVFVFFQFEKTPLNFNPLSQKLENTAEYKDLNAKFDKNFAQKNEKIAEWKTSHSEKTMQELKDLHTEEVAIRGDVKKLIDEKAPEIESNDKDYVFIYYILNYLPTGIVGLLIAVILSAAMSSTASELNALATTTVVDIYKRNFAPNISEKKYLNASRLFTLMWGMIAIFFAVNASLFENLIQAVNIVGSLFYGVILGVFAIAFLFPKIGGKATMWSILIVEPIIILLYYLDFSEKIELEFLWLNPIGCLLMIAVAGILERVLGK
ncbi:sodium:solute symporter [Frigoriflavimonas asaccharolytica]|uniref:Na+/proline symporter n=1 Tax=Frigoriflavimonas asaccharolytica TaxID=2735899 RepID=A0A8J8KAS9_9FLAO|nr:sodium:solute symporter [Frigoriflavimonas asaccharolytica]NRS91789.1 Na+/proline symporter [Frigoriflavimonas asaccharolytica]